MGLILCVLLYKLWARIPVGEKKGQRGQKVNNRMWLQRKDYPYWPSLVTQQEEWESSKIGDLGPQSQTRNKSCFPVWTHNSSPRLAHSFLRMYVWRQPPALRTVLLGRERERTAKEKGKKETHFVFINILFFHVVNWEKIHQSKKVVHLHSNSLPQCIFN